MASGDTGRGGYRPRTGVATPLLRRTAPAPLPVEGIEEADAEMAEIRRRMAETDEQIVARILSEM